MLKVIELALRFCSYLGRASGEKCVFIFKLVPSKPVADQIGFCYDTWKSLIGITSVKLNVIVATLNSPFGAHTIDHGALHRL